jgi:hypothetical protein
MDPAHRGGRRGELQNRVDARGRCGQNSLFEFGSRTAEPYVTGSVSWQFLAVFRRKYKYLFFLSKL